jgi:hypothetical protein
MHACFFNPALVLPAPFPFTMGMADGSLDATLEQSHSNTRAVRPGQVNRPVALRRAARPALRSPALANQVKPRFACGGPGCPDVAVVWLARLRRSRGPGCVPARRGPGCCCHVLRAAEMRLVQCVMHPHAARAAQGSIHAVCPAHPSC